MSTVSSSDTKSPLVYVVEVAGETYRARRVRGAEALSAPFRFELAFGVPRDVDPPDPRALLREPARVLLVRDEDTVREIHGIVTSADLRASRTGAPDVSLVVEPVLALARYIVDLRVFRDRTVPEIVTELFAEIGVTFELRLSEDHPRRPYCVQFRETTLHFVQRLLEDEGIFYFFGERARVVLADRTEAMEPLAKRSVPYRGGTGLEAERDAILSIGLRGAGVPGRVTLRDFNPEKPKLDLDCASAVRRAATPREFYDYPGEYEEPADGARKARLHAEAFTCAARRLSGTTTCAGFAPGVAFDLEHATAPLADGPHYVVSATHALDVEAGGFALSFEALEADVPFRPARVTEAPRILNPLTAFVTGPRGGAPTVASKANMGSSSTRGSRAPDGEDIHTDAWGRTKVHFHWDRRQPLDDTCSYWVPAIQDNTGQSCSIPRVGWEVLVHFLEGDPDRPVVLGRLYNSEEQIPEPLPAHKTRTQLRSLSSPGRQGANYLELEDRSGDEWIRVHAERDMNVAVAIDRRDTVLGNESHMVHRDDALEVGHDQTIDAGGEHHVRVDGNQMVSIGGDSVHDVTDDVEEKVAKDHALSVGGAHLRFVGKHDAVGAAEIHERVGGAVLELSLLGNSMSAADLHTVSVGGGLVEVAGLGKTEGVSGARVETIGGALVTSAGADFAVRTAKTRRSMVGGALSVSSKGRMDFACGAAFDASAATTALAAAESVTIRVGKTSVVFQGGAIAVEGASVIRMNIRGDNQLLVDEAKQI